MYISKSGHKLMMLRSLPSGVPGGRALDYYQSNTTRVDDVVAARHCSANLKHRTTGIRN